MVVPSITVHPLFGKLLFASFDIGIGWFIWYILRRRGLPHIWAVLSAAIFVFNPFVINISTRGNADSLVCLLVLAVTAALVDQRYTLAAIIFGVAVHVKIYPIIYALPIALALDEHADVDHAVSWHLRLFRWRRVKFALESAGTFFSMNLVFYFLYGYEFISETFLYHLIRRDNRHNFSVYFYELYLSSEVPSTLALSKWAFLPQLAVVALLGGLLFRDLPFALLLQTIAFVAFNKVCTAQYFLWYLALFPLCFCGSTLSAIPGWASILATWLLTELHWLAWAGQLEDLGLSTFGWVWFAGLLFFAAHVYMIVMLLRHHRAEPVFRNGRVHQLQGTVSNPWTLLPTLARWCWLDNVPSEKKQD